MSARAAARCALPGFDRSTWNPKADREIAAEAEMRAEDMAAALEEMRLGFDFELDRDGCPWAWAQSRYAVSVSAYMGTRTLDNPRRTPSLRTVRRMHRDEVEPEQLLDAIALAEAIEDGALSRYWEIVNS